MGAKRIIHPEDMYPAAGYARAVQAGNTLYISGHIPRDDKGQTVGKGDVERQAVQVFENIGRVLKAAGATFDDIVKINIYALHADYRLPILAVRDRYLKRQTFASTYIVPQALATPDLLLEIEAIAVIDA
ncbi:MAG: RidA family protein [Candidatus Rokubacteria bacterium]|nr:RidA family protein [Candidatus Rokubacteria bacterium]